MSTEPSLSSIGVEARKDALMKDIKVVAEDADSLIKDVGNATVEEVSATRANIENSIGAVRTKLHDVRTTVGHKVGCVANCTHAYVNQHPWKSIGLASIAGLMIGFLLRRR
ncbi:DUF883 family protein [Uliginosibacterium gangwonense]|uniref:DUF883 family protein n=1 Tax=Uliginosibacterium gangwonense TaxID=392736 RepID=UPI00036234FF|nr:DUF883 family protein [Uliginosibacterium gangwonense]